MIPAIPSLLSPKIRICIQIAMPDGERSRPIHVPIHPIPQIPFLGVRAQKVGLGRFQKIENPLYHESIVYGEELIHFHEIHCPKQPK